MKKHRMTTKALSVLLTVIMLFTTISVGIIVPEANLTASAAEGKVFTITATDAITQVNDAIKYANDNKSVVVTIKLSENVFLTGSIASFETITGSVIFDLSGWNFSMSYYATVGQDNTGITTYQLPSSNQGKLHHDHADLFENGMFIIASGGTMQIINTSTTGVSSTMQVITEYEDDSTGESNNLAQGKIAHQTSSSLIYNAGTLIVGDKNDAYNGVNLYSHSVCRNSNSNNPNRFYNKAATANAYTVTVDSSTAVFKMYGGKIQAAAAAEARRDHYADVYCYALNVEECYSAEIYGGEVNIPDISIMYLNSKNNNIGSNGIYQSTSNASYGGTSRISAIRNNSSNLYIFDVDCYVESETDSESSKDNKQYTSCIWAVSAPYIYGGAFEVKIKEGSGNSSAENYGYIVRGGFRLAENGVLKPVANYGGLTDYSAFDVDDGEQDSRDVAVSTVFVGNNETENSSEKARNAINMFDYSDFSSYLLSYSKESDVYYGDSVMTSNGDAAKVPIAGKYLRNGYLHTGWQGKTHPGGTYSSNTISPIQAGINQSGGSLFLTPTWTPTVYNIEYNLSDSTEYPVTNKDIFTKEDSANRKYNTESTAGIIAPVRPGYQFAGWRVDDATVRDTDSKSTWEKGKIYGGWDASTNTPINLTVLGMYGDITLTATWTPLSYDICIDTNADGIFDEKAGEIKASYSSSGMDVNKPTIPNWLEKDYYTFDGYYEVKQFDGNWNLNDKITVATFNDDGTVYKYTVGEINSKLIKKYGNITMLTPKFTPIDYTISFDMNDDDVNREDKPSNDPNDYIYNVETVRTLPVLTLPGQRFEGWKVVSSEGNWPVGGVYTSIPAGMHGNVKFIAESSDKEYVIEVVLADDEIFNANPDGYGYSFSEGGSISGAASKDGWDFVGWQIVEAWSHIEGDVVTWTINGEPIVYDATTGLTFFNAGKVGNIKIKPYFVKHEYNITFNANGGTAVATEKYKIDETKTMPSTSRNGYTFLGWRVAETAGSWVKGTVIPAGSTVLSGLWGNVTLVAEWTETPYTVTLDLNGGEGVINTSLSYKTTASTYLKEIPVKTGYTFKGWEIFSTDGNWNDYKAILEAKNALITDAVPAGYYGNVTLRAVWNITTYRLQFVRYPEHNKDYTYETSVVFPAVTAPGQEFFGWELSSATGNWDARVYKAGETYTQKYGNATFVPLFNSKSYTITFVDADGVSRIGQPLPYKYTEGFSLKTHSKPGYTFLGWKVYQKGNDSGGWTIGSEFKAGAIDSGRYYGDVTLMAVYDVNAYNVTFVTDGGEPIADLAYTTESDALIPAPKKTGYDFGGWKVTSAEGSWVLNDIIAINVPLKGKYGNVTLTAQWIAHKYVITWDIGKGEDNPITSVAYGDMPVFPQGTPVKASTAQYDYQFIGWSPSIDPATQDTTYVAQFKSNLREYDVTWKYPEGTEEKVVTQTYKYGEHPVFAGSTPVKESTDENILYRFAFWQDAAGNKLENATIVTGDVVYTASFTEVNMATAVMITWKVDGVLHETYWVSGETPSYPGTLKLTDKDGYSRSIAGWTPAIEVATVEKTYTAQISKTVKDYEASFDLNGGKYAGQTVIIYNKDTKTLNMPLPEKTGYTFMGWKVTDAEAGSPWENDKIYTDKVISGKWGEVSFEAVWTTTKYTLTVKNDGAETKTEYTIESNSFVAPLNKEGYDLTGWFVITADAGSNWMPGDTVAKDKLLLGMHGNVTIEPVWTAKTYKLNWISGVDDDIIQTVEVKYGEYIVSYAPVSQAGYTAKWEDEIPVTMPAHDVTITATYTAIEYFIRFNTNGAGTIEGIDYTVKSPDKLPEPTRAGADFGGWKVSVGDGSWIKDSIYDGGTALNGKYGNVTLTAVWNYKIYNITWKIEGAPDRVTKWYYGAQPSYDGIPYKAPDFNSSYEFTGKWLTENNEEIEKIPVVTGDATYKAVFKTVARVYTVKWDVDGKITEQTYTYGQAVECPYTSYNPPVRPSTNEYDFTFLGWSPEITLVTGDITYTAIFDVYTKIQGLRIDQSAIFIDVDDSSSVTAIIAPSTATSKDVEWASLNQNIATVNENGKIVGVSAGETLIRVQSKDGKFKAFCLVNVAPVTTDYIVVSAAGVSTTRLPGEAVQLYATIMPENASNKIVRWTTSNPAVATVDANGLVVFGSTTGSAVITAMSDGYASGSITVNCTTDDTLIKDDVKTYVVMFNKSSSTYIIADKTYESINIVCKEGDTIEFLLTEPHFVTLNATQFERDTDGVYRIKNIKENYTVIASERPDLGFEPEEPGQNDGTVKLSFFERLKNFFRSIVEFFRGLFGG